jgi:hypothetical protein
MAQTITHRCSNRKVRHVLNTIHYSVLTGYDLSECDVKVFHLSKTRSGKVHCHKPEV